MTRLLFALVAGIATLVLVLVGGLTAVLDSGAPTCAVPATLGADASVAPRTAIPGFSTAQIANARTIISTAITLGVPVRGWVIAVAVALQESSLLNQTHGDSAGPDSRGLFQQRTTWGPARDRLTPAKATRMFFLGGAHHQPGLLDLPHWQSLPLNDAAQHVQHSQTPTAYADREDEATRLVAALTGLDDQAPARRFESPVEATEPAAFSGALRQSGSHTDQVVHFPATAADQACADADADAETGPAAARVVAYARSQVDVPYRWGGNGPADGGWDCSGLAQAAYASAGMDLPRTAQTQYDSGPHVPAGTALEPGDLLFFGSRHAITHVGIYIGNNQMIDAPHAGAPVRQEDYHWSDYAGAARPV